MTTLISFLGKGQDGRGYREANYQFDDGDIFENSKYFGLVLAEKIQPKKIILLGTSGSMWDVFFEQGFDKLENQWLDLSNAVKSQVVTAEMLQPFEQYLSGVLKTEVQCVLIPFAKDTKEQIEILSVLSEKLGDKEKVVLDVTHSFRHLPMLSLVVARFLKRTQNIDVEHIYYGALEMSESNKTPVIMLDGMLTMLDWVDALTTFDKDGDYGQFADLLERENFDKNKAELIKQASFFERTSNSTQAYEKLNSVFDDLEKFSSPIFDLFKPQLVKRLTWFKRSNRGLREQHLAREYLQRYDYVRAVIYAQEGKISGELFKDKKDLNNHQLREEKLKQLSELSNFKKLRNKLAHGNQNNEPEINTLTRDEETLLEYLKNSFKKLFG